MRDWYLGSMTTVAIAAVAVGAVISLSMTQTSGQAPAARPASVAGKPNFSGIWQANNEANWDLQAHAARHAAVTQQGFYPLRLCAGAGRAGSGARRHRRRARIARRRAGRRGDSL